VSWAAPLVEGLVPKMDPRQGESPMPRSDTGVLRSVWDAGGTLVENLLKLRLNGGS